jgi:hypothetical protein
MPVFALVENSRSWLLFFPMKGSIEFTSSYFAGFNFNSQDVAMDNLRAYRIISYRKYGSWSAMYRNQ